ncbi:hypothetical protein HU200_062269 [Digitaria exilis]|uniref:Uncharacterized protein n=1 Tax=Digitaria exilis TaxID=1010633 RepID=A0A835DXE2_9POAL|nr:hypothetical protein HU200_062269 [Digitaria exilis]
MSCLLSETILSVNEIKLFVSDKNNKLHSASSSHNHQRAKCSALIKAHQFIKLTCSHEDCEPEQAEGEGGQSLERAQGQALHHPPVHRHAPLLARLNSGWLFLHGSSSVKDPWTGYIYS